MKHLLTLFLLIYSYMLCGAQATTLVVNNKIAGTLSQRILYDDKLTVENLVISGEINADDITYLYELNRDYNLTGIIDMSDANIVNGGKFQFGGKEHSTYDNTFNVGIFPHRKKINKLIVPRTITKWDDGTYTEWNGAAGNAIHHSYLNVDSLIVDCPNLEYILNGIGSPTYLYIGEGIKYLNIASNYLDRLPGGTHNSYRPAADSMYIYLPESLLSLDGHGGMGTPKMTIYSKILRPDKLKASSNNKWEESVLINGVIYAPNDTREYYESSIFKNLMIVASISVKDVRLDVYNVKMHVGETRRLNATVYPLDASNKTIIWRSSNEMVATVDEEGIIKALSRGEALIEAASDDNEEIYSLCNIVVEQQVVDVLLSRSTLILEKDSSFQLEAQLFPENANNKDVRWYSTNEQIATVSDKGIIRALKSGETIIRVESLDSGLTAECALTVVQPIKMISVVPKNLNLKIGENTMLTVSVLPADADDKSITWQSADESVATVSNAGIVTAKSSGKTKIFAISNYTNDIRDYCDVTVSQPVSGIRLDKSEMEINEDDTALLSAFVIPENASNKKINWTSSDISIVTVTSEGMVHANSPGQASIIATSVDGGFVAICKVKVIPQTIIATAIRLNHIAETITEGETLQLYADLMPQNVSNQCIDWVSTAPEIATVNASGLVRAVRAGTAIILATTNDGSNLTASCEITVKEPVFLVTKIFLTPSSINGKVGDSFIITATVLPENATNKELEWESSITNVATVADGIVKLTGRGTALITAKTTDGSNIEYKCPVSVSDYSGIEAIVEYKNSYVKIFNLQGNLIFEGRYSDARINPGTYIIVCDGNAHTIKF